MCLNMVAYSKVAFHRIVTIIMGVHRMCIALYFELIMIARKFLQSVFQSEQRTGNCEEYRI